jgi:hypothetical protein
MRLTKTTKIKIQNQPSFWTRFPQLITSTEHLNKGRNRNLFSRIINYANQNVLCSSVSDCAVSQFSSWANPAQFSGFLGFQVPEAQHTNKFHLEKWNDWAQVGIRASPRSNVVNGSSAWCRAVSE